MVKIRLARHGSKKRPFYHIVVTDSRNRRDGRYIEKLGYFNPLAQGQSVRIHLDQARVDYWQGHGAQLSDRVVRIFKDYKDIQSQSSTENPASGAEQAA